MLKNDTRCEDSVGAWTAIETPSSAFAVPSPNATLIASVIAVEVEKSASLILVRYALMYQKVSRSFSPQLPHLESPRCWHSNLNTAARLINAYTSKR